MNKKGFTLIELLTVIAILGILVLLAAPKFLGYTEKANIAKIQTGIKAVETAIDLKSLENPEFTEGLVAITPDKLQEINDSGKLIDKNGFIKEDLEGGKNVPLKDLDVKWNSGGEFIINPEDDSVYYYNEDINVSKNPDGSATIPGDNNGDGEGSGDGSGSGDGDGGTPPEETTPPVEEPNEPEITYPITLPDGNLEHEDGTITTPDGQGVIQPDGSAKYPDGTVVKPDGTTKHPDGIIENPDGTIVKPNVIIATEDGTVTIETPASPAISLKKWAKGDHETSYFQSNGTVFNGNTFEITEVGIYTVYIKTTSGFEFVYKFTVTQVPKPLRDNSYGSIIKFNDENWILIDPTTGYIAKETPLPSLMAYDTKNYGTTLDRGNTYEPTSSTNIGFYLNNTYYQSIKAEHRSLILSSSFSNSVVTETTGKTGSISTLKSEENKSFVSAKIGMLSISDWKAHTKGYNAAGALNYTEEVHLLNGADVIGSNKWWFASSSVQVRVHHVGDSASAYVVPTLYIGGSALISNDGVLINK